MCRPFFAILMMAFALASYAQPATAKLDEIAKPAMDTVLLIAQWADDQTMTFQSGPAYAIGPKGGDYVIYRDSVVCDSAAIKSFQPAAKTQPVFDKATGKWNIAGEVAPQYECVRYHVVLVAINQKNLIKYVRSSRRLR